MSTGGGLGEPYLSLRDTLPKSCGLREEWRKKKGDPPGRPYKMNDGEAILTFGEIITPPCYG
jgi:hypothetical protein